MDLRKLITDYVNEAIIMQIATAKNNQPWACTVHFANDEDFHLFWISTPERRHSQEIEQNDKVAGTIVLPHTKDQKPRGLQFEGIAKKITDKQEQQHAMDVFAVKRGLPNERKQNILAGKDNHVLYQIVPNKIILFDTVNFPDNPRQEYVL